MGAPSRKLRVLIVEDERFVVRALERGLSQLAEVVSCSCVDEALAVLAADDGFDVVMSDLGLVRASGLELYAALEGRHDHLQRRFILMTGEDLTNARVEVEILRKPFDLDTVRTLITRVAGPMGEHNETR